MGKPNPEPVELSPALLNALPDGIVVVDSKGTIRFASLQLNKLAGYSQGELLGRQVENLIPERYHQRHNRHRARYERDGRPTRAMGSGLRIVLLARDGSEIPVDIALSAIETRNGAMVLGAVRDARERVAAEQELRESRERDQLTLSGVRDYAIFMLDSKGRVTNWNSVAERIKGYKAEEIIGRPLSVFYAREDVRAGKPKRALRIATETGRYEEHGWRVKKDGERFWAHVVLTALLDENGELRGFFKVTRDMTEFKRSQDRLLAVQEIGQAILAGEETDKVLATVCRLARELAGAALATLALPDADGTHLVLEVADGAGDEAVRGMLLPLEGSLAGEVYRGGRPLNIGDAIADARAFAPAVEAANFGPTIVVPLEADGRVFGTLSVVRRPGSDAFGPEAQKVVELFAAQASVAIEYARFRNELRRLAVKEDRERIGRELHDGVIQSLFGVGMNLQATAAMAGRPEVEERIEGSVAELDRAIRDLRNYIFGLRPGLLADRQLGLAIQKLARDFEQESGLTIVADVDATVAAGLSPIAGDVVQLVRESLSNVMRHAGAATCRVSLAVEDGLALLEIEDDGRGFDPNAPGGGGQGLRNLRERAAALKGVTEVRSAPNEGTTVRISLPL